MDTAALAWPVGRLADAVEQLTRASGLSSQASSLRDRSRSDTPGADAIDGGVERVSRSLEFESEAADVSYDEIERTLGTAGPALLTLTHEGEDSFLALMSASGASVRLLAPDGRCHRVPTTTVAAWLRKHLEQPIDQQIDRLLAEANVHGARRAAARHALFRTRLGARTALRSWQLRPTPGASIWRHIRYAHLTRRLLVFVIAYAAAAVASVAAWWLIGAAAIEGRFDPGTLLAWSFLLLSLVPLGVFARWSQGVFMVGVGGILKMKLLAGALRLDPDETRRHGIGQHLARVIESESIEALALAGGFYALAGVFEVVLAALAFIAAGLGVQLVLLMVLIACVSVATGLYFRRRQRWAAARVRLTHDLVERMVGHRTRLVQESRASGHDDEDEALEQYVAQSTHMDRAGLVLSAIPRVWLLVGLSGLAPQFVNATSSIGVLAAGLGATLLAYSALGKMIASLVTLGDAAISWTQVGPLVQALERPEPLGRVELGSQLATRARGSRTSPLIAAQDLSFAFPQRAEPVIRGCTFRIDPGDRIHLDGPSGSGKSTLVSLLTALRVPDSGLVLLGGLDRATLGVRGWRRRVVAAPQFQDNHLFADSLAFNLLMGRRWPPTADDLRWADTVCRRLGLGNLLDRMPAGLFQVVGETGWQLSHGERSRVYMARALLQGADLVILDESFAELDPDNLQRCLPEAAALSKSLLVVAHA